MVRIDTKGYRPLLIRAYAQEDGGKVEAALADLEEARKRDDKIAEIYKEKAFCLVNLKKFDEAIAEASTAIHCKRLLRGGSTR
jgi:tetratricopeptide (TPR) repeat protein